MLKKILNHSFWLLVGNSIGRLAMFMTNIIAARLLPQEVFGQFSMIRNTISSVEGIISGALGSPMIKRVSEIAHEDREKLNLVISALFFTNIFIAALLGLAIYFLSPLIVDHFFIGQSELVHGLAIGAFLLIATTLSNTMQTILIGFEEFKKLAYASIGASIVSFPLIVALIYYFDFYGAIWGVIVYFFSDFIWKYFQLRTKVTLSVSHTLALMRHESKKLLSFSTPLLLSVIVTSVSFWYARVMVIDATGSFAGIAVFDAAFQWLTIIMIITSATTNVALTMLSRTTDIKNTKNVFQINLVVNSLIAVSIAIVFIVFSKSIMAIYGQKYIQGTPVLILLSVTSIFFTLATLYNRYIVSQNRSWIIFYVTLVSAIVLFVVLTFFVNQNASGLAKSILLYYLTSSIFYIIFLKKGM